MSDLGRGYYIITLWASAGGGNAAALRSYVKNTYSEAYIVNLGKSASSANFGSVQSEFQKQIDDGASVDQPTMADLNAGLMAAGGQSPGLFSVASKVVVEDLNKAGAYGAAVGEKAIDATLNLAKWLPLILIIGGVVYLAYVAKSSGMLKSAAS